MEKEEIKYCSKCGTSITSKLVGAENLKELDLFSNIPYEPYTAFSTETGKRQYVKSFTCPQYSKVFGSNHDNYLVDELITL